jgi:death-on-curing family protein
VGRRTATVAKLALEAGLDIDETLIALWEAGFGDVNGAQDVIPRGSASRARRALGLASRRELASPEFWEQLLKIDRKALHALLLDLAVATPYDGKRLRHRAINRLRGEARSRGLLGRVTPEPICEAPSPSYLPFTWSIVGHPSQLRHLTRDQVERIHFALVKDFEESSDPLWPAGVKNPTLLESALLRPRTSNGASLKYPTIEMAAGALLHSLVHNHPFHNGNKRTALVSMLAFLDENGRTLTCDQDALFKLVLQLAQHALVDGPRHELVDRETHALAEWIKSNSRWIEQGDRAIPWRRLRRLLSRFDCELSYPTGVGNRINITRVVTRAKRGIFFRRDERVSLHTQAAYVDEGTDVQRHTIHKLRRDLELDDENGLDSKAFYDNELMSPDEFIVRYRKTLRRLAKL